MLGWTLMSEWKEISLGELVTFQRGHDLPQIEFIEGPYLVAGSNGPIGYHNKFTTKGPGLTLGRSGNSIGVAHYYENNFWAHNTTLYSKEFHNAFPKFVYYLLKNFNFSCFDAGSAVPTLNRNHIHPIKIKVPPLSEQHSIASILSSLDDKIDMLHRQNKSLEALAEALFRQWFVEEVEDGWETKSLGDVCLKTASGGTPSTKVSDYYGGNINWYSTKELNDNFLFESVSRITQQGLENSSTKLFPENTIVIAIYAAPTVGRLGILCNEACFNQAACGLIADETKVCFEYLYLHLLLSRQKLNDMASGSAQQNLNVGIIKSFPIPLPPKDKMDEFRNQSRFLFQKIKSNSIQIRTLTRLRNTLLPKLISGEIKINITENKL